MGNQRKEMTALVHRRLMRTLAARMEWHQMLLRQFMKEQCYIWGTGQMARWPAALVRSVGGECCFVDNNAEKWGTLVDGIPCISPQELSLVSDPLVLIGVGHGTAVARQLADMGVRRIVEASDLYLSSRAGTERINADTVAEQVAECYDCFTDEYSRTVFFERLHGYCHFETAYMPPRYYDAICRDNQYFQDDLIHFTGESVLVDCGAYTGDTLADFLRRGYPFRKYIAYELSRQNYEMLRENMRAADRGEGMCVAYNYGTGERDEKICYQEAVSSTTFAADGVEGEIVRLSGHLRDEPVSFIKMDIEGAEMGALRGAEDLIRRRRPDLAICVYHSISDLYEIPLYIHSLVPEYRLYLRHHTPTAFETVCYAVI